MCVLGGDVGGGLPPPPLGEKFEILSRFDCFPDHFLGSASLLDIQKFSLFAC